MKTEYQANLALHQTYMVRGWKTGVHFARPGRQHYTLPAQAKPGFVGALLRILGL